jgi:hypothetical protein
MRRPRRDGIAAILAPPEGKAVVGGIGRGKISGIGSVAATEASTASCGSATPSLRARNSEDQAPPATTT